MSLRQVLQSVENICRAQPLAYSAGVVVQGTRASQRRGARLWESEGDLEKQTKQTVVCLQRSLTVGLRASPETEGKPKAVLREWGKHKYFLSFKMIRWAILPGTVIEAATDNYCGEIWLQTCEKFNWKPREIHSQKMKIHFPFPSISDWGRREMVKSASACWWIEFGSSGLCEKCTRVCKYKHKYKYKCKHKQGIWQLKP